MARMGWRTLKVIMPDNGGTFEIDADGKVYQPKPSGRRRVKDHETIHLVQARAHEVFGKKAEEKKAAEAQPSA